MPARLSAFLVWAALAASAVFWGLRLAGASPVAPPHTLPVGEAAVAHGDLTRLFGAEPVPSAEAAPVPTLSSRFKLIGLAAPRAAGTPGVALISVDGKPARAYRLGAAVDADLVVQSIEPRAVALGVRGTAPSARLELPPLPPPSTGTLAPAATEAATAPAPQPMPPTPLPQGTPPATQPVPQVAPVPTPGGPPGIVPKPGVVTPAGTMRPQQPPSPNSTVGAPVHIEQPAQPPLQQNVAR
jgi:general secretion pathway protein C